LSGRRANDLAIVRSRRTRNPIPLPSEADGALGIFRVYRPRPTDQYGVAQRRLSIATHLWKQGTTEMATTLEFGDPVGIAKRTGYYKAPKFVVLWSCAACVAATIAIGFTWGGWVTGAKAMAMSDRAEISGQAKLAAAICADRFITGPDARAQTALLRSAETWQRGDLVRQGGWLTLPGRTDPVVGAANLCVQQILNASSSN